jgi:hypothetical protein
LSGKFSGQTGDRQIARWKYQKREGTTALRNIQLLKWCREFNVNVEWNFLAGFPGEDAADYATMLALIDAIPFLQPPTAWGLVRLDRFSPYHRDPATFGMVNIRPVMPYRYLYPFSEEQFLRMAYYFDFDYADGRGTLDYSETAIDRICTWMTPRRNCGLWVEERDDGSIAILDERDSCDPRRIEFDGWQAKLYLACDRVRTFPGLLRDEHLESVDASEAGTFIGRCISQRLMGRVGDDILALAVHRPPRWREKKLQPRSDKRG